MTISWIRAVSRIHADEYNHAGHIYLLMKGIALRFLKGKYWNTLNSWKKSLIISPAKWHTCRPTNMQKIMLALSTDHLLGMLKQSATQSHNNNKLAILTRKTHGRGKESILFFIQCFYNSLCHFWIIWSKFSDTNNGIQILLRHTDIEVGLQRAHNQWVFSLVLVSNCISDYT